MTSLHEDIEEFQDLEYVLSYTPNFKRLILKYYTQESFAEYLREMLFPKTVYLYSVDEVKFRKYFNETSLEDMVNFMYRIFSESDYGMTNIEINLYNWSPYYRLEKLTSVNFSKTLNIKITGEIEKHKKVIFQIFKEMNLNPVDVCKIIVDYYI